MTLDILTEQVIPNMATKWFEMGLQLGVNPKDLNTIQHDAKNSKAACTEMFIERLGNANIKKPWKKVAADLLEGTLYSKEFKTFNWVIAC